MGGWVAVNDRWLAWQCGWGHLEFPGLIKQNREQQVDYCVPRLCPSILAGSPPLPAPCSMCREVRCGQWNGDIFGIPDGLNVEVVEGEVCWERFKVLNSESWRFHLVVGEGEGSSQYEISTVESLSWRVFRLMLVRGPDKWNCGEFQITLMFLHCFFTRGLQIHSRKTGRESWGRGKKGSWSWNTHSSAQDGPCDVSALGPFHFQRVWWT